MARKRHSAVTQRKLTKAIKTVAEEEDRGRNLMIFGLKEDDKGSLTDEVTRLMKTVC